METKLTKPRIGLLITLTTAAKFHHVDVFFDE